MALLVMDLFRRAAGDLLHPFVRPVQALRAVTNAAPGIALTVLTILVVSAVMAIRGSRPAALAIFPLALAWLLVNAPFEGPTLIGLSATHGLTAADLISVVAVGIAGWRLGGALVGVLR